MSYILVETRRELIPDDADEAVGVHAGKSGAKNKGHKYDDHDKLHSPLHLPALVNRHF